MLPLDVTVTTPPLWLAALIPYATAPVVEIPNAPVLLVMMTPFGLAPVKLIPATPLAGVMAWVRLLTLSVVTGGVAKSTPLAIPAD